MLIIFKNLFKSLKNFKLKKNKFIMILRDYFEPFINFDK